MSRGSGWAQKEDLQKLSVTDSSASQKLWCQMLGL